MTSDSIPPPAGGSNLKYGIIGVGLLAATAAVWFGMQSCEGEQAVVPPAQPDAGVESVERGGALAADDLVIPELVPDAGPPPDAGRRVRYVTRYVGGGGGNWSCSGSIPPAAAASRFAQNQLQFRNCYERRLKVNHQLEGRVSVNMRVNRTGEVDAVQLSGTMRDAEVLSCVRRIANNIRFPAPTGGSCAVVAAPLNFTPRN